MLYSLFQLLPDFPGSRLMTYISFRAIVAAVLALLISIYFGKYFIAFMKRKHITEVQRDEKTDPFNVAKKGVPTMGGIVIIFSILLPVVLIGNLSNIYLLLMLITTLILGALGFADDYIKTFRRNKDGLNGWVKIAGQVTLGLIVGLPLRYSPVTTMNEQVSTRTENNITIVEKSPSVKSTQTTIPFVKHHNFNYADLFSFLGSENKYRAGWIFFVLLTVLVVAAVSNGANLTDGLDGLCTGTSAVIGVALAIMCYLGGNVIYSSYLNIMYIPNSAELVVFAAAFIGATIGFLWYNSFPAQVFMGDTGSLTLGGIIAVFAILIRKELLIPLLCAIFFVEDLSVMIQVAYFKYTKKRLGEGKRIFKMTPLHHHFQKPGNAGIEAIIQRPIQPIPESKIVMRFTLIAIFLAAITFVTLKIR